jgi:hypothetical protein
MEDFDDETQTEGLAGNAAAPGTPARATYYPDMFSWVEEWLLPHWAHRKENWSDTWWEYPEALSRLEAVWRAWEFLRLDGALGMSVFWRDHLDPHMRALTAPDGPFWGVRKLDLDGKPPKPWPSAPVNRMHARIVLEENQAHPPSER